MRTMRFPCAMFAALLLGACQGPSRSPEDYLRDLPGERAVAPETAARAAADAEEALRAVLVGRVGEARALAERALDVDPRAAIARVAIARCLMHDAQEESPPKLALWRHAEGELLIAARLAPDRPEVHLARAELLTTDGHLSAAAEALDQGLARTPRDARLLREAGRLRYELGEERASGALLGRYLAEAPADADTLWMLAQIRSKLATSLERDKVAERQKALREAARAFHAYVELVPTDGQGWLGEAWARAAIGGEDAEPALKLYELAGNLLERSPEPWFGQGTVLEALGRTDAAVAAYRKALERDDRHVGSLLNLAALLAKGDAAGVGEAKELCRRLTGLRLSPQERQAVEKFLATHP